MAYSLNPQLVRDRAVLLAPLAEGKATAWACESDPAATRRLAYRIRECLWIAAQRANRAEFPELARAAERFTIVVVKPGLVEARPKQALHASLVPTQVLQGAAVYEPARPNVPTVGLTEAEQLIDSWRATQPSNDPLRFNDTRLSLDELTKLHKWASDPAHHLMVIVGPTHVTLAKFDKRVAGDVAWTPPKPGTPVKSFDHI